MNLISNPVELVPIFGKLTAPGSKIEVRMFRGRDPRSAFFDATPDGIRQMVNAATSWNDDARVTGVYFCSGELSPDFNGGAAGDNDVVRRRVLFLDFDPVRPGDTSATDSEKAKAWDKLRSVVDFLIDLGFPQPITADSGNGFHAHFRIDEPARDSGLVSRCLQALDKMFSDSAVKLDVKVGNASRLARFYGTVSRLGESTQARPPRLAGVVSIPDGW